MLGGVCGGLGEHVDIDPTILRLIWAVITLLTIGTGILVYIIAWIIIPEEPRASGTPPAGEVQESR
jgi:phage shock protein C